VSLVLVTGGTGTVGSRVVRRLTRTGHEVRVLTRRAHISQEGVTFIEGDMMKRSAVDRAVDGAETIVHCAGQRKGDEILTRNLIESATRAGRPHIVSISVVGADRVPVTAPLDRLMFGHFAMKRNAERIVSASGLPWTILRATQFYDSLLPLVKSATRAPIVLVPAGFSLQPVDADEVAARLFELSQSGPSGFVDDIAGPRVYTMGDLIGGYLARANRRRMFITVRLPGRAFRSIREGANIAPDRAIGVKTWEQFVDERTAQSAAGFQEGPGFSITSWVIAYETRGWTLVSRRQYAGHDRVVVVTGGTGGIGKSCAERFVKEGATVVLAARRKRLGESVAAALGERALFVTCDVTIEEDIRSLIEHVLQRFGRIDCFISNAGAGTAGLQARCMPVGRRWRSPLKEHDRNREPRACLS
jgi:uncharacterized protein YbjT (DUF2867 family)